MFDLAGYIVVSAMNLVVLFFFQAEDGIREYDVTGVQTCALPFCARMEIYNGASRWNPFSL